MKKNGLMKLLLCVALLFASVIYPQVTKAEEATGTENMASTENFVTVEYDVDEYRSSTPYTYPKKAGYIFAGWYTDEACTEDTVFAGASGKAYAKFVDGDILGVKCQIEKDTKSTAETTNLRIVTSVGSNMYEKVGFKVEFEGQSPFYTSIDTVYKTIDGWVNDSNQSYTPDELFSTDSKYLAGCTVTGFPNDEFDKLLTITARWKTLDGTTVEGGMKRFSIDDVIVAFDYDVEDTASRKQKVAKVGEEYCTTFADAVSKANDSTADVTISLLQDIDIGASTITINNDRGNNVTIDGCGHELVANKTTSGRSIEIHQTSGTVTIQNLDIDHSGDKLLMRIGTNGSKGTKNELTVNLTNVDITSTGTYSYCLIGTQEPQIFNVNMTDVTADWDKTNTDVTSAFIRCGGTTSGQILDLKMNNCYIDVSGAELTQGVYFVYGTTVTFTRENNTTFTTAEGGSVYTKEAKETADSFLEALTFANASDEDVKIRLMGNITYNNSGETDNPAIIDNVNGKHVTIEGNNKTLTTFSADDNKRPGLRVHQSSGTVTIQNLNITHEGKSMLLRMGDNAVDDGRKYNVQVNLNNVKIISISTYPYCLVATQDQGYFDVNMTGVIADWDKTDVNAASAFVRCGGSYEQEVNLDMTGCAIDVSGAAVTQGVYIYRGADVTVTSDENTTITTADGICGYTKEVNTKDAFIKALTFANASTEDVTIKLTTGIEHTISQDANNPAIVKNANGKHVVIDGNNKTLKLSSSDGKHPLRIDQSSGTVTIKNLTIAHSGDGMLLRIGANGSKLSENELTVNLTDVTMTSTGTYRYCLIGIQGPQTFNVNMSNVTADCNGQYVDEAGNAFDLRAFIRGSANIDGQTLKLTMAGCEVDVVDATPTCGLYIDTTITGGEIKLENTNITTADGVATYYNRGGVTVQNDKWNSFQVKRVVLLSDTHYSTNNKILSSVAGPFLGYNQSDRIALALADVTKVQTEKGSLNAVMVLGDLSTDDPGYRFSLDYNYVKKFKTDFMEQLSVPSYALAGNHDGYTVDEWNDIFGYDRGYAVEVAGAKFIMLDTYEAKHTFSASGSAYRGMDEANLKFLETELEKEFDGPIFLCAHWFTTSFDDSFKELLNKYPNVVCMFHGHSHQNGVSKSAKTASKYLVNTGGYAYDPSEDENGIRDFNRFDIKYAWGYQVLEWNGTTVRTYHVKPARSYTDSSKITHVIEKTLIEDELFIQYNNE